MKQKYLRAAGVLSVVAVAAVGLLAAASAYATVPTFSQSSVTVGLGQSVTVIAQNTSVYMLSNSSPTTASVSVNGSQVTITGAGLGSTQVSFCGVGTASDCSNLSVTVQSAAASTATALTFAQNNLSMTPGVNQAITITGGNGNYTVSSNSNGSVASASISGNSITVSPLAAGSATINVCDTASNCAALSVTVNAAGSTVAGQVVFGTTNPTITPGQVLNVSLSGGSNYYISLNSSPSIATGNISGATLAITGVTAGSNAFTVCSGNGTGCSTITVTVSGTGSTSGNAYVVFSNMNPTVAVGQTLNITVSAGYSAGGSVTGYVVLTNQTASVAAANVSNTTLSITGLAAGSDVIAVCGTGSGCNSITVTVTGAAAPVPVTTAPVVTTTPAVVTTPAPVAGSSIIAAIQSLQNVMAQLVTQIQSLQVQLGQIVVQASAGSGTGAGAGVTNTTGVVASVPSGGSYYFTEYMAVGSQDAEVTALQQQLIKLGFLSGSATGYYGAQTEAAVKAYQTAHGLTAAGYVGPSTRAALNAGN